MIFTSILNKIREWLADQNAMRAFRAGEWVESEKVQKFTGMSFAECFRKFDFSRTAEWWSVVGKTAEERQQNGQKISTYFRIKQEGVGL